MVAATKNNFRRIFAAVLTAGLLLVCGRPVAAQYRQDHIPDGPPVPMPNPEIVEKPNAIIPLELEFTRSDGAKIKLGEFFQQKKPVILSLVYFSCPSLCGFTQDALKDAVIAGPRDLKLGQDYDIVVVSIDPDDTPATAAAKRINYLGKMNRSESQTGFTYLTGSEENIRQLADTVGFGYRRNFGAAANDAAGKFAHSGGIFICAPYGRLSQTIRGVEFYPDTLHYALLQAADGKIGSGLLGVGLSCGAVRLGPHGYEHNPWFWAGTAGGGASVAFMAIFLGVMWRGEWKKKHAGDKLSQIPASL